MLVSYNLLKKYVELPQGINPQEVADKLTMATVEVESVKELGSDLKDIVVGKIEEIAKHPNADKLKLVEVNIGKRENIKIVCGGTNLKKEMLVVVALPEAQVRWHGEGELVKLESTKIRGEESFGMICASNEIGLSSMFKCGANEIADLSHLDLELGKPLAEVLNLSGIVLDIDNKSLTNRPDLWGHYGISRELAAIYDVKLNELELYQGNKIETTGDLKIEIKDNDLCPHYLGCVIENVKIEESPEWLKQELLATGHSVINNIVDVTNYVMEEVGQPLHAFDKKKVDNIIIRRAEKGEKLVLLDESELKLNKEMLAIANEVEPVALAGVMGGKHSGINVETTAIVLEAANFDAMNIRKTSQQIGVRSDSSMRFEKALDVNLTEVGMRRALQLIQEICPQVKINPIIVEAGEWKDKQTIIEIKHDFIIKRLGKKLAIQEIKDILSRLGFKVEEEKEIYKIKVPSWRATGDVNIPEDIVEEVARIYGYDNLTENVELVEMTEAEIQPAQELEIKIKNYLSLGAGMSEVLNYPWADERIMNELDINPIKDCLEIANPPAPELKYLQTSLLPNLIKNIHDNIRYFEQFKIFELARVYNNNGLEAWHDKAEDVLPVQPKKLVGAVVGSKNNEVFLEIKGIISNMILEIGNWELEIKPSSGSDKFIDNSRYLEIFLDKVVVGWVGEVNYAKLNFKGKKVALFEIDWEKLITLQNTEIKKYKKLSQFPVIERDIAVEVEWDVKWGELIEVVNKVDKLIGQVEFLSEFPLEDKKSLAFRITYQAERTLKDEEVEKVEQKILSKLGKKFGAELRK